MTKTTDNLPPVGRETILVDERGRLSNVAHNFLTILRDQSQGKNRVSDLQSFVAGDSLSTISDLLRVQSTGGEQTFDPTRQILPSFDGREITVEGMSDSNPMRLVNGNGIVLKNKDSLLLKENVSTKLHYNASKKQWIELGEDDSPSTQTLSATSSVNPNASPGGLIRVQSTGGVITLTSDPQIESARDGKNITIEGISDPNSVKIIDGNGVSLKSGTDIEFKNNVTATFHFNKSKNLWIEN